MRARFLLIVTGCLTAATLAAHDGEGHDPPSPTPLEAAVPEALARPHRLADGSLVIVKPVQHVLGLRTVAWAGSSSTASTSLLAEVSARPAVALAVVANEAGRLEAPEGGWPLPGRRVKRNDVLAWLKPALSRREIEERNALIADLDQRLIIADLNVDRLYLQGKATEGTQATGNVYYEQTLAERDAMREQRELLAASIAARVALRAPVDGPLLAVTASAGDVVAAGQPLFQFGSRLGLRIVAIGYDATLATRVRGARLTDRRGDALILRGMEPVADGPGWRLLFDLPDAGELVPGRLVRITLALTPPAGATVLPPGSCGIGLDGQAQVWVHRDAERFEPLKVMHCDAPQATVALASGARIVVEGASLLSQYR